MTKKMLMLAFVAVILSSFALLYAGNGCKAASCAFVDKNKDSKCDNCGTCTEADCKAGCKDKCQSKCTVEGKKNCAFVDADKDGKCDKCGTCTEADCKDGCKSNCKDKCETKVNGCKTGEKKAGCGMMQGCGK